MYTLVPNLWKKFKANLREKCSLEQSGTKKDGHFVVHRVKKYIDILLHMYGPDESKNTD